MVADCMIKHCGIVEHAVSCSASRCARCAWPMEESSPPASPFTSTRTAAIQSSSGTASCRACARTVTRVARNASSIADTTTRSAPMACRSIRGIRSIEDDVRACAHKSSFSKSASPPIASELWHRREMTRMGWTGRARAPNDPHSRFWGF